MLAPPESTGIFSLDQLALEKIERKVDNANPALAELGQRFRAHRKERGLHRVELAKQLKCTDRFLLEFEVGAHDVELVFLQQMADAVGSPLTYLLLGSTVTPRQAQTLEMAVIWAKNKPLHVTDILASL